MTCTQEAAAAGASLVVLPEMWNCPYSNDSFPTYAEDIDGGASPSADALSAAAAANAVTLVGGSIPERSTDRLYNTCLVFSREGALLAKHRKVWYSHFVRPGASGKISSLQGSSTDGLHMPMSSEGGSIWQYSLCKCPLYPSWEAGAKQKDRETNIHQDYIYLCNLLADGLCLHAGYYLQCSLPLFCACSDQVHLFDIDIPGGVTFKESETLSPGEAITVVDTDAGRLGIGICYDIRFPELAQIYAQRGAQLIVYPGAWQGMLL